MEQLDLVRTDSISPTSTSDSTEVDFYSRVFILGWVVCNCASDFRGKLLLPPDQLFILEENFCHCALQEMKEFLSGSKVVHRDG